MHSFRQQLTSCVFVFFLLICIVHSFRLVSHGYIDIFTGIFFFVQNELEHVLSEKNLANEQAINTARHHALEQILSRRSFYDPAFSDSWSSYFEKKRSLFDPAYSDWANSFKRSDE